MTSCPSCGHPLVEGVALCNSCGAAVPTLPDGLFREERASQPTPDVATTAAFTPDFLSPPAPKPPTGTVAPELPYDLFRDDPLPPEVTTAPHDPVAGSGMGSFGFRQLGAAETAAIPVTRAPVPLAAQVPPRPPAAVGSPESDLLPSERPLELPEPVRGKSGVILLAILLFLLITAVIGGLAWWNSSPPPTTGSVVSPRASAPPSRPASALASATAASSPAASSSVPSPSVTMAFPPAGAKECTSGVAVNESTSCPFAANVAAALPALAEGESTTVTAASPTTGQTYAMACKRSGHVTCTGGSNAVVYVKVGS